MAAAAQVRGRSRLKRSPSIGHVLDAMIDTQQQFAL
jgi:hypothetical protein